MDGEPPTCSTMTERKARKRHSCVFCGRAILPATRYQDLTGIWDGEPRQYRFHLRCHRVYEALGTGYGDCLAFEEAISFLRERTQDRNHARPINVAEREAMKT